MRRLLFLTAAVLLLAGRPSAAQEPAYREDLRFVEALRGRGDNDLAMALLTKMAKDAPPELLKELPLEFAKTGLRIAAEEPETGKRLLLYKEARENFQKFIDANPGHPRVAEANVDIARVLNLQGKTELSKALLSDDVKIQRDLAAQARATLEVAGTKLKAAAAALEPILAALPDPDGVADVKKKKEAVAARARVENELKQTQIDTALNLYDQANTYFGGFGNEQAADLLARAKAALGPIAGGASSHPITWKARAWLGRVEFETDSADKARTTFQDVISARPLPAAAEGLRLALYFRLLVMRDKPTDEDKMRPGGIYGKGVYPHILDRATAWRKEYPRFLNTPEGNGITFMLAQIFLREAETNKAKADNYRTLARGLLREVESSENEFTDQARRLKIQTIARQGGFKVDIAKLRTFEDCYIRSQYEAFQMGEDAKKPGNAKEFEERRKARIDSIIAVLKRALAMPEVKNKSSMELNNARAMLAYWLLNTDKLPEAIEIAEGFARHDPRSSQAETCAVYALQAYLKLIGNKFKEEVGDERSRMFALAQYMEERWPRGLPGELARHSLGLQMLKENNFAEAIKKLGTISSTYGSYPLVRFQIADAALKAEKENIDPIAGDRPGDYRKRALAALQSMPESALGGDPFTNQIYVSGKAMLGRELFKSKRFQQMLDLAGGLLPRLDKLKFNDDEEKDKTIRNQLRYELVDVTLYARYGLADELFRAGDNKAVVALLDLLVDAAAKEDSQERTNLQKTPQLATGLLRIALQANIQLGKIERSDLVLDVLDKVANSGDAGSNDILKLLAYLIRSQVDEVRKKGDKEALAKAVKGYSSILGKRIAKQKNLTPDFIRVLADCFSSMGEHEKAAAELGKIPPPKGKVTPDDEKKYHAVQILMIRELRLSNKAESLKKARVVLDEIMGTAKKPGWGMKEISALKEQGIMLEREKKFGGQEGAFAHWAKLTKNLAKHARERGGPVKENYLECYYHMVYSYVQMGNGKPSKADRDKAIHQAAAQIVQLERSWEDFGSDVAKKRFMDLLASEPALKEQYEVAKKKK